MAVSASRRISECYFDGLGVEKDVEEGYRHLQRAAELGDPSAQLDLSIAYSLDGGCLKWDCALSLKWLTLSAKRGCRLALFFLGRRYLSGFLAPLDRKKGLDCLAESAEKGFPLAIYWAGLCCRLGVGANKDDEMALH
ncbi:MAG TPA: sel1 repeat family protein [Candidatus Enteromonas pullicola]|uniref:Sel1 repeat family protein n=1 Tax=Candidatus Alloenteromonas pullicola TaxID=2840784 RepID=A0A9D1S329_9FIRM|nr:sel1 repeat family protein [Candidatus Enteromonas pullicola]